MNHYLAVLLQNVQFCLYSLYFILIYCAFSLYAFFQVKRQVDASDDKLLNISATQAVKLIEQKKITCAELLEAHIKRIEQVNPIINAAVVKMFSEARQLAREADEQISSMNGECLDKLFKEKPLYGIPFTTKDAIEVDGKVITCGVYAMKDSLCTRNAVVIDRLRTAGGILLAVTNVPEACMWFETNNTIYGKTNNPYDTRRTCGGSSGGEGALISAQGSMFGVGSDIGGSIRIPSFCNGVFGLKTTPGVIPLTGHIPAWTGYKAKMNRVGPLCRYAEDLPILVKVMSDNNASIRLDEKVSMKKIRVFYMEGISGDPRIQKLAPEMRDVLKKSVRYIERKYDLIAHRIDLPLFNDAMGIFAASFDENESPDSPSLAELMLDTEGKKGKLNCISELPKMLIGKSTHSLAVFQWALFDQISAGMPEEIRNELIYKRERLIRELRELLGDDGLLFFPTWPCTAQYHYEPIVSKYNLAYTCLFNALAFPVVQCPMGLDKNGMPLGVQVIAAPYADRLLLAVAAELQEGFGGWSPARK